MAEIKVAIKGDDADFKRKMAESSAEARHFAEQVKESFAQSKEAAADMMGEAGFGGIKKVLAGAGVVTFGASLIEAFKHGVEEAINFEKTVSHLANVLGPAQAGMADWLAGWVESVSGAMGSFEENMATFRALIASGMDVGKAQEELINIQNAAAKLDVTVGDLGKAFVEMKSNAEIPKGFFREFPAIGAQVRAMLPPAVPAPGAAAGPEAEEESLIARVKAAGGPDWMLRVLLPSIAPGGLQSPVRQATEATAAGQLANLGVQFEEVSRELGNALLPAIKEFTGDIRAAMPEITETVKHWSEDLKELLDSLHKNLGWLGQDIIADRYPGQRTVEGLHDKLFGFLDWTHDLKAASTQHQAAAQALHDAAQGLTRAVNPQ